MGKKDKLSMNPMMAYRKEQKKKEIAKGKKQKREAPPPKPSAVNLDKEIKKLQEESSKNRGNLTLKRKLESLKSQRFVESKKQHIIKAMAAQAAEPSGPPPPPPSLPFQPSPLQYLARPTTASYFPGVAPPHGQRFAPGVPHPPPPGLPPIVSRTSIPPPPPPPRRPPASHASTTRSVPPPPPGPPPVSGRGERIPPPPPPLLNPATADRSEPLPSPGPALPAEKAEVRCLPPLCLGARPGEIPPLPSEPPPRVSPNPPLPAGPPTPQAIARRDRELGEVEIGPARPTAADLKKSYELSRISTKKAREVVPDTSFLPSTLRVRRQKSRNEHSGESRRYATKRREEEEQGESEYREFVATVVKPSLSPSPLGR